MSAYTEIVCITQHKLDRINKLCILAAVLLGSCIALWAPIVQSWIVPTVQPSPALEKGCRLPRAEAESTLFIVVDQKIRCYRYY